MNIKNLKVNKRFTALILAGVISVSLVGCSSSREKELESQAVALQSEINSLKNPQFDSSNVNTETTLPSSESSTTSEDDKGIYIEIGEPYYSREYYLTKGEDDGYLRNISLNGQIGVIDVSSRKIVISPSYKSVEIDSHSFIVTQIDDKKRLVFFAKKDGQLDIEGNMSEAYDTISDACYKRRYYLTKDEDDGYIRNVTIDDKKGEIDASNGKVLIQPIYTNIGEEYYSREYYLTRGEDDGYIRNVSIGNKNGVIDASDFSTIIPVEYSNIELGNRDIVVTDTEGLKKTLTYEGLKK